MDNKTYISKQIASRNYRRALKIEVVEEFFWENYPHEISWGELKEANPELYCRMLNAAQALILAGKLSSSYLPEGV